MKLTYNLQWLTDKFDNGEALKFLFFWGHSGEPKEEIGKFCFSQWFELPFLVDGVFYKTTEHWMMANKALLFEDIKIFNKIIAANAPGEVKQLGRQVMGFDDMIWAANRMQIVIDGNIHKFNQHANYADYLLNTKNRILVEASPVDKVWGIGLSQDTVHIDNPYFWNGENLLGFALMEVRKFLAEFGRFEYSAFAVPPPWKMYPNIDPLDLFWRMGRGEDTITEFAVYYDGLSDSDKIILRLANPAPYNWKDFYS